MKRIWFLVFLALSLACTQTIFADIASANNGSASSCANTPSSPITDPLGTLHTAFTCTLYNDASSYSIPLTALMTEGGANLSDNVAGAGYVVVINGDPNTLADDNTGLFDENLWVSVLFWPGDQDAGTASDSLTVYWPGTFPAASDVQSFDENLYGTGVDPEFFVQYTGAETVYAPGSYEYDVFVSTPEPAAMTLLASCLALLGGLALRRRLGARPV